MQEEAARFFADSPGALIGHDTASPVDVGWILDHADWARIFRTGWNKSYIGRWDPEQFGVVPEREEFGSVPLELSLTPEDWMALQRKCRKGFGGREWLMTVVLHGNMLFFLGEDQGICNTMLRIAHIQDRFVVTELYSTNVDVNVIDVHGAIASDVSFLAGMLPGRRYGLWGDRDDKNWYWREPNDAGYLMVRPYPWYAFDPEWLKGSSQSQIVKWESVNLDLGYMGDLEQPLLLSHRDQWILQTDPNLCPTNGRYRFWFQEQESLLNIYGRGETEARYAVFFDEVEGGYTCTRGLANLKNIELQLGERRKGPAFFGSDIRKMIRTLLDQKLAWYEKQKRWHKAAILPPVSLSRMSKQGID